MQLSDDMILSNIFPEGTVKKEKEQIEKKKYEKPVMTKHGQLKDVTAGKTLILGCTRI